MTQFKSSLVRGTWRWVEKNYSKWDLWNHWEISCEIPFQGVLGNSQLVRNTDILTTHLKQCVLSIHSCQKKRDLSFIEIINKSPLTVHNLTTQKKIWDKANVISKIRFTSYYYHMFTKKNPMQFNGTNVCQYFFFWAFSWTQSQDFAQSCLHFNIQRKCWIFSLWLQLVE